MEMGMQKFVYETKCRRCGRLNMVTYADATDDGFEHFKSAMIKHANGPHPHICADCNAETLHDVVTYGVQNLSSGETDRIWINER